MSATFRFWSQPQLQEIVLDNEQSRLSRLVAILTQLQSKRLLTSTELAVRFQVSVRTIYRDIRTLTQAGVPVVTEEGKGYRLLEGYRLPPIMFTEQEANALITAEKLVSVNQDTSFTYHYTTALTKIKAVLRDGANDKASLLADRVAFEQHPTGNVTSNFLSTIQLALTNLQVIEIEYYSPHKGDDESVR
jgi:predicted DNA-binding transcriptional regulator YafY